jgi:hypothetical protein
MEFPFYSKMDPALSFDVVDTPPLLQECSSAPPPEEWPSLDQFSRQEIRRYRDIDIGCYRLLKIFNYGVNKFGNSSFVLKLESRKGDVFQVWAPSSLACSLKMRGRTRFIWNHGLQESQNGGNPFFSFSLC